MGLNRQGVQRIVGDLLAENFVELRDNPHHRNAKLVVMTRKGQDVYKAALEAQAPWVNMLAGAIDAERIRDTKVLLDVLKSRLGTPEEVIAD
jgi:DNA-binding MarR family transcriptional regulator